MKSLLTLVFAFIFVANTNAQLLSEKTGKYTKKDSLRGTLSPARSGYDVTFYHLDVKIDIEKKYISGNNTMVFDVVNDLNLLQFDLFSSLKINTVEWKGKKLKYKREHNAVFVQFPQALKKGSTESLRIFYEGKPTVAKRAPWDGGFVFKKDANNKDWVGVACQGLGASVWWPNKDHQSDEPDSMLISITSPTGLEEVSNGRLRKKVDLKNGYTRHDWFVSSPINNYDVSINIGDYFHWSETYTSKIDGEKLSLDYYVLKQNEAKARKQFEQVPPMMDAFEKRFSKYPFYKDGYKLVETPYLGMEHQSCIAYGNEYKKGYLGSDLSGTGEGLKFDYIIIHETAHEWWGNSLTSYDIADMWIHEGFGQYSEAVYLEEIHGKESAVKYLNGVKRGIANKAPVIGDFGVNKEGSGDMYPKGALFLHTLRSVINNDKVWWDIIYSLQTEYRHKNISTEDVLSLMNRKSGLELKPLFDQYLRHAALPLLELNYLQEGNNTKLSYKWNANVKEFNMPIDLIVNDQKIRIEPSVVVKEILLQNTTKENIKVDEKYFYIKTKV